MDAGEAIAAVENYIRGADLDYPTVGLLADRFASGWSVYAPFEVNTNDPAAFLDMPVGRAIFLISDSGRIEQVSSSTPPALARRRFAEQEQTLARQNVSHLSVAQTRRPTMKFEDTYFSRENRYSIGIESISGRYYVSIPVSNGVVDYEEYYQLTPAQYHEFLADPVAALDFVEACRRHEHDRLLLQKPGSNRGTPV